jgi:ABC-type multidrug transport system ATPase subunit/ABC-type transporter Mla maintaining outer membrane lipid asymmetry permease subunit MlaE
MSQSHSPINEDTTAVEIRDLSLRAGQRLLVERGSARFEPGQITLIVGPSGAGKSLLLRVLAGLIGPGNAEIHVEGQLLLDDREVLASGGACGQVGVVFQNFALFDELSPLDNVRFAAEHRAGGKQSERAQLEPGRLLAELGIPHDVRTASLSGGQRQRLAIARTLAFDPEVILYDEPTSGLDAATGAQVARMIQATHRAHGKTSIIVTHDDRTLAPIADRIYLLDPATRSLRVIDRQQWDQLETMFSPAATMGVEKLTATASAAAISPPTTKPLTNPLREGVSRLGDFFVAASRAAEEALVFPARLIPRWKSPSWGLRYLVHYWRLVADPSSWLYLAVAGAISGYVATYFVFRFLPFRSYTEPLIVENLLAALGFTTYRVFVPLLASLLIAARCGAAVASDVGAKVYGQQWDALRTLDAPPPRYLATNIHYAFLSGILLLVTIAFYTAKQTSLVVFVSTHPDFGPFYWDTHFHHELRSPGSFFYRGTGWLVAKLLASAAGIGAISYCRGARPKHSSTDVSLGITSTVLWATLYVLIVHLGFALVEF